MRVFRSLLLSTAIGTVLASINARADSPVAIGYVEHSLTEASIAYGPWTLHQTVGRNRHDASGIAPPISTPYNPPTTAYGIPYNGYCTGGRIQTARGVNPMQPYYFPFLRGKTVIWKAFLITARATSRRRRSRQFRSIGARAGLSPARRWG